ncbi:polysaccharide pyruvyl transferase family protein [Clostridium disporicum]|uniref:Exopolysaccharide biosynthesis protein n=1 Tax=Clostridium disporicum TaxID=84024 RepID=A0A174L4L0_9CLOT|nr:polysaccharide pyruvyl transferase family protein [Clostridium disporicum]CUP17397.1 Exopolysaccharide biosynthesis protein [Clostridium disporicum]
MKKNILILNQGITENYGDVAINNTITSFFKSKGFNIEYYPFWLEEYVFGKENILSKILMHAVWKIPFLMDFFNKNSIINKFKRLDYDAIIIGGGELLSGHRGFNSSLNIWSKFAEKRKIPIYLLGVSGDTNMPRYIFNRNKKSLNRFSGIFVRDSHSYDMLRNEYNVECKYSPDVVFAYNSICQNDNADLGIRKQLLCVPIDFNDSINKNMNIKDVEEYNEYLIKKILDNLKGNSKVLITCSVLDDVKFTKSFYNYAKNKLKEVEVEYVDYTCLDDYIELVKKSNCVISGRMHALILAFVNKCKIVPIPFKEKLICFNNEYSNENNILKIENKVIETFEELSQTIYTLKA